MTGSCRAIMAALRSVRETYTSFMVFIAFSLPGSGGCRLRRGVDAFGVVHLQPGQGRIEHANDPQRLGSAAQPVLIVFIQRIDHTGAQRIFLPVGDGFNRSEEHTSELQSLMRISYAVFCLKKN